MILPWSHLLGSPPEHTMASTNIVPLSCPSPHPHCCLALCLYGCPLSWRSHCPVPWRFSCSAPQRFHCSAPLATSLQCVDLISSPAIYVSSLQIDRQRGSPFTAGLLPGPPRGPVFTAILTCLLNHWSSSEPQPLVVLLNVLHRVTFGINYTHFWYYHLPYIVR